MYYLGFFEMDKYAKLSFEGRCKYILWFFLTRLKRLFSRVWLSPFPALI